jgi:hypothetical protein
MTAPAERSIRDCESIDVGEALASVFYAKASPTLLKTIAYKYILVA